MNSRHPEPRRVLGRCRAAVRGPDPGDPRMGSFFRVLGIKNNENERRPSKKSILQCFLFVFVIDFSFSLCFTIETANFLIEAAPLARHRPAPPFCAF